MSNKTKVALTAIITFGLTCVLFISAFNVLGINIGGGKFGRLEQVADIIENSYIGECDWEKLEDEAISAMVAAVDDPYSAYYDPESALSLMSSIEGNYVGVGIEVAVYSQTNEIVVISSFSGSPARKAGVKSGDILYKIDGVEYDGATLDDAVSYMKGVNMPAPEGTTLTITVKRGDEVLDLELTREAIDIYNIERRDLDGGLVYLRYPGFTSESAANLKGIVNSFGEDVKGIILDLRENPGGDLDASIEVCDLFLDDGLIMYTEDKAGNRQEYEASAGSCQLPMAVLVDGGSASASEIVAGCMQARGRAVIIGEKTYGKGVAQAVCRIGGNENGGLLKLTTLKNYRPDGVWLNEGVTPDIEVENDPNLNEYGDIVFDEKEDAPLAKAVEELQ